MKLNNKLITSLEAFRQNFDFCQAWNKIDVVVRDLSPSKVAYGEDDTAARWLYKALADPSTAQYIDGALQAADGTMLTRLTAVEATAAESLGAEQQVRVIALCRLGGVPLTKELISHANNEVSFDASEIILQPGQFVKIHEGQYPAKCALEYKLMYMPDRYQEGEARVGNVVLKPGDATFGVFAGAHIVAVSPNKVNNDKYYIYYDYSPKGVSLVVRDRVAKSPIIEYSKVRFFALLGDGNFVVIDGRNVFCYEDEDTNRRLQKEIEPFYEPRIVVVEKGNIVVTYKNGKQTKIKV